MWLAKKLVRIAVTRMCRKALRFVVLVLLALTVLSSLRLPT